MGFWSEFFRWDLDFNRLILSETHIVWLATEFPKPPIQLLAVAFRWLWVQFRWNPVFNCSVWLVMAIMSEKTMEGGVLGVTPVWFGGSGASPCGLRRRISNWRKQWRRKDTWSLVVWVSDTCSVSFWSPHVVGFALWAFVFVLCFLYFLYGFCLGLRPVNKIRWKKKKKVNRNNKFIFTCIPVLVYLSIYCYVEQWDWKDEFGVSSKNDQTSDNKTRILSRRIRIMFYNFYSLHQILKFRFFKIKKKIHFRKKEFPFCGTNSPLKI